MKKRATWGLWIVCVSALSGVLGYQLLAAEDRSLFLPGPSSHGHYQIELACESCHVEPFGGAELVQGACTDCHGEELEAADDTHPRSKFTDPRNADRVARLDARYCVTCHQEHVPRRTREMAVTLPEDFCAHCHQDIGEDRPSHQDLAFTSCADAGCHNFHDNRALYEDFLAAHAGDSTPSQRRLLQRRIPAANPDSAPPADAPADHWNAALSAEWRHDVHAAEGVNCSDCHGAGAQWRDTVSTQVCGDCHEAEQRGFEAGRHGMRIAAGLSPMTPDRARLPMKTEAHSEALTCASCHGAHDFDTGEAAVDACLGCHDDSHSRSFKGSPHHRLWQAEQRGEAPPGSGVSCASCHMPREAERRDGKDVVRVVHNQNANLRPNEKMIRGVCMDCHTLRLSIDALASERLIRNNFRGPPLRHVRSIDMAVARLEDEAEDDN